MKRTRLRITFLLATTLLLVPISYAQRTQTEIQKLLADDGEIGDSFGRSVAIDGDTAVIGAYHESDGGFITNGAAYIYTRNAGTWTQQAKLLASDKASSEEFGLSVAIDGDTAVIGSWRKNKSGAVYVFTRMGGTWMQQAKLLASDKASGDRFGWSVAIDGDTVVIGASYEDDSGTRNNGAAYVFTRTAGTWTQQAKLLASDKADLDRFGESVAIDGDTVVIGAKDEDDSGTQNNGAAYVFTRTAGTWTQQAKLLASDKASSGQLGFSVAIDGDTAIIGAWGDNGAGYVFNRTADVWTQQAKLLANKSSAYGAGFGCSVAIEGDTAIIGSEWERDSGDVSSGAAYVFTQTAGSWAEQTQLLASDRAKNDHLGFAVALDGGTAVIGAVYKSDGSNVEVGAAYVFDLVDNDSSSAVLSLVGTPAAVEGDYLRFKVRLSEPVNENVSFRVRSFDDSATAVEDYKPKGGERLLAQGQTEQTIWVPTYDDGDIENNERMRLELSEPKNAVLGTASAEGIIVDNDDLSRLAQLNVSDAVVEEGGTARFEIALSRPTRSRVKIAIQTSGISATSDKDFVSKSGIRVIPAGETTFTIFVPTMVDDVAEQDETLSLNVEVRSNNAIAIDGDAMGTIVEP